MVLSNKANTLFFLIAIMLQKSIKFFSITSLLYVFGIDKHESFFFFSKHESGISFFVWSHTLNKSMDFLWNLQKLRWRYEIFIMQGLQWPQDALLAKINNSPSWLFCIAFGKLTEVTITYLIASAYRIHYFTAIQRMVMSIKGATFSNFSHWLAAIGSDN